MANIRFNFEVKQSSDFKKDDQVELSLNNITLPPEEKKPLNHNYFHNQVAENIPATGYSLMLTKSMPFENFPQEIDDLITSYFSIPVLMNFVKSEDAKIKKNANKILDRLINDSTSLKKSFLDISNYFEKPIHADSDQMDYASLLKLNFRSLKKFITKTQANEENLEILKEGLFHFKQYFNLINDSTSFSYYISDFTKNNEPFKAHFLIQIEDNLDDNEFVTYSKRRTRQVSFDVSVESFVHIYNVAFSNTYDIELQKALFPYYIQYLNKNADKELSSRYNIHNILSSVLPWVSKYCEDEEYFNMVCNAAGSYRIECTIADLNKEMRNNTETAIKTSFRLYNKLSEFLNYKLDCISKDTKDQVLACWIYKIRNANSFVECKQEYKLALQEPLFNNQYQRDDCCIFFRNYPRYTSSQISIIEAAQQTIIKLLKLKLKEKNDLYKETGYPTESPKFIYDCLEDKIFDDDHIKFGVSKSFYNQLKKIAKNHGIEIKKKKSNKSAAKNKIVFISPTI